MHEDHNWVQPLVLVRNEFEKHLGILLIGGILFIILRLWFGRLGVRVCVKYFGERIRLWFWFWFWFWFCEKNIG